MSSVLSSIVTNSSSMVTSTSSSNIVTVIDGTDHTRIDEMLGISAFELPSTTLRKCKYKSHKLLNESKGVITEICI